MKKMQARSVGELVRAWEALPVAVRERKQPDPKHSIGLVPNEGDVELGHPGHFSEGRSVVQSGVGGDRR